MILTFDEIAETCIPLPHDRLDTKELLGPPGVEHYRLLAYLAQQFNHGTIIDIGTHKGCSALALSTNPSNRVYTFDLEDKLSPTDKEDLWKNGNVVFSTDNLMDNETRQSWRGVLLSSPLIVLDIDPHQGSQEFEFYQWLKQENYAGLLVLDDIHYFKGMRDNCWYKIPSEEKRDATGLGHWSGTGLVRFDRDAELRIIDRHFPPRHREISAQNPQWTVVTAYVDLTKRPDASDAIRARDTRHYLAHAAMTMAIDQPLVVYCEPTVIEQLRPMRPSHLMKQTRFVPIAFDDLALVKKYYERVVDVRRETGYNPDPRNTPSYYLFCMIRYELLMRTMAENPFDATHFAWCNICIERMNWRNMRFFPSIWQEFRDRFSTCYIDYQPESLVIGDPQEYYKWGGRCSMCSGFFTGARSYMLEVCREMVRAFEDMLEKKLGHADEQLLSIVYFRRPELFQFYIGDYQEMIVNYGWLNENPHKPIQNLFRSLYKSGERRPLLYSTTKQWLTAHRLGCFQADESMVSYVRQLHQFAQLQQKEIWA